MLPFTANLKEQIPINIKVEDGFEQEEDSAAGRI